LGSGATAIDAGDLVAAAADVDVILASTSSPEPVITAHDVERIQAARAGRPLAILDLAVPRDVAPVAAEVDGVHLFDLDRLGGLVETNLTGRRRHLPRAEALVAVDVAGAVGALAERDGSGTTIRALTKHAETLRRGEVERARRGATLNEAEIARLDIVTRSLVRKLLHAPIAHLRERDDEPSLALALRDAFDLESGGVGRSR